MSSDSLINKKEIFGKTVEIKASGGFAVTAEMAQSPLFYKGTAVRSFCLGCGYSTELSEKAALDMAKKSKIEAPSDWQNHYFETKKCIFCSDDFQDIRLEPISKITA